MHISILTTGSRGDIQPYVALGKGLRQAGYQVQIATHAHFQPLVKHRGLDFAPVEGNPREILASETGQIWLESGQNVFKLVRQLAKLSAPIMKQAQDDFWRACQGTDAIFFAPLSIAGYHIAEKLKIPCVAAWLQPFTRTRYFPALLAPPRLRLGHTYNYLSHLLTEQLTWQPFRKVVNAWRVESLNLPPFPLTGPLGSFLKQRLPLLYGFSPAVIPKPSDWPDSVIVTGYWFLDRPADWQPPASLVDFLAAGSPPLYIGFGSMISRNPARLVEIVVEALEQTRQRCVLSAGWGGLDDVLRSHGVTDDIFVIDDVPHDWLFPQMAAVVHHGGAGTAAAGFRAGVPSIIVPFFADQPFWGYRAFQLGVGPRPIFHKKLTVAQLADAIRVATTDQQMQKSAARLGQQIRAEDGVARAVEAFERSIHAVQSNFG